MKYSLVENIKNLQETRLKFPAVKYCKGCTLYNTYMWIQFIISTYKYCIKVGAGFLNVTAVTQHLVNNLVSN